MRRISASILAIIVTVLISFNGWTQSEPVGSVCSTLFASTARPYALTQDNGGLRNQWSVALNGLEQESNSLSVNNRSNMGKWLSSLFFFDFHHLLALHLNDASVAVESNSSGVAFQDYGLAPLFDLYKERSTYFSASDPLTNFFDVNSAMQHSEKIPKLSWELLMQFHRELMKGGIEGLPTSMVGVSRKTRSRGMLSVSPARPHEVEIMRQNPYLNLSEVVLSPDGLYRGYVGYPGPDNLSPMILQKISRLDRQLFKDIEAYKAGLFKVGEADLTARIVRILFDDSLQRFEKKVELLGQLNTRTYEKYMDLCADFHRELISIHPFANGNGRTMRTLLNYLLTREGLPPTLMVDGTRDYMASIKQWRNEVKGGVYLTLNLVRDLSNRLKSRRSLFLSPFLLYPKTEKSLQKQDLRSDDLNSSAFLDSEEFFAYLVAKLSVENQTPAIRYPIKMGDNWNYSLDRVEKDYRNYSFLKKRVMGQSAKAGRVSCASIGCVDRIFAPLDYVADFQKGKFRDFRERQTYFAPEFLWRNLDQWKDLDETAINDLYTQPLSPASAEMRLQMGVNDSHAGKQKLLKFNRDVVAGRIKIQSNNKSSANNLSLVSHKNSLAEYGVIGRSQPLVDVTVRFFYFRARHDKDLEIKSSSTGVDLERPHDVLTLGGVDLDTVVGYQQLRDGVVLKTFCIGWEGHRRFIVTVDGDFVPSPEIAWKSGGRLPMSYFRNVRTIKILSVQPL